MSNGKTTLPEIMARWNNGELRGAQRRLANLLGLTEATVSRWMRGDFLPAAELRPRLARELGVSVGQLMAAFSETRGQRTISPGAALTLRDGVSAAGRWPAQGAPDYVPVLSTMREEYFPLSIDGAVALETLPLFTFQRAYRETFALRYDSDSANALGLERGDYIILMRTEFIQPGKFALLHAYDDMFTIARPERKNKKWAAFNLMERKLSPIPFGNEPEPAAQVVGTFKKL